MMEASGEIPLLITDAHSRIQGYLHPTRLVHDANNNVWLKCEQDQKTGSFKWRGALAKLTLYSAGNKIVTASTGNHGLAVATAAQLLQLDPVIFVPTTASTSKVNKIAKTGARIIQVDGDSLDAELAGKSYATQNELDWVSPYNDKDVISGQGTLGLELTNDLKEIKRVYVTVGGGGLVSGIASWIKSYDPAIEVIGCQPAHSPEMYLSTLTGHVVNEPESKETLSDGSAGPLEEDSITFPICRKLIDRFILISENEIANAINYLFQQHGMIVEGAAGVAMAAAIKDNPGKNGNAVVILCGGNIDPRLHADICKSPDQNFQ